MPVVNAPSAAISAADTVYFLRLPVVDTEGVAMRVLVNAIWVVWLGYAVAKAVAV